MRGLAVFGKAAAILLLMLVLGAAFGCSNGGAQLLTPGEGNLQPVEADISAGHNLLGYYTLHIDPDNMTVTAIPNHSALLHANVAPYLLATCPDCIKFALVNIKWDERVFTIEMEIRNPMKKVGYDIKGIIALDGTGEYDLLNPDVYYGLWVSQPSPFIYFAKTAPNMQFPPASSYKETFQIYISETHTPMFDIPFAVDAHWPGVQEDPIWIRNISVNNNGATVTIDCEVVDFQDNLERVWADTSLFTGSDTDFVHISGNLYRAQFPVGGAPGGLNKVLISAKSQGTDVLLHHYADVFVNATGAILEGKVFNALTIQNGVGTKLTVTNTVGGGFEPLPTVITDSGLYSYNMQPGSYNIEVVTYNSLIQYDKMSTIYPVVINPDDHVVVDFGLGPSALDDYKSQICCINGQVFNNVTGDPVVNAQVSISGGSQTNGVFQNRVTDSRGHYVFWKVPCKDGNQVPISQFTITCVAQGYMPDERVPVPFGWNMNTPQENFYLSPVGTECTWEESFENGGLEGWTFQTVSNANQWHIRNDVELYNVNLTKPCSDGGFISTLPPDDTTNGRVWQPWDGTWSLWYGGEADGSFIYDWMNNNAGGTSIFNHAGAAISPVINLTSLDKATLTWQQIWEIEGVDPSIMYDYMKVYIKDVSGGNWILFEHSNPTTEPVPDFGNEKNPQTSGGFFIAPVWQAIVHDLGDLDNLGTGGEDHLNFTGKQIQLKFEFGTVDPLYNGFRGWLVDDLCVIPASVG